MMRRPMGPQAPVRRTRKLRGKSYVGKNKNFFFLFLICRFFEKFLAGGRCPSDPPGFGWGGFAPPDPHPKRSSAAFDRSGQNWPQHSIEAAKLGRLDQMLILFAAPPTWALLTTVRPGVRPTGRPAERPRPHDQTNMRPRRHVATC